MGYTLYMFVQFVHDDSRTYTSGWHPEIGIGYSNMSGSDEIYQV